MARRKYYQIVKNPYFGWDLKLQGTIYIIKNAFTKQELLNYAASLCCNQLSEVIIYDHWGKIEDRVIFGDAHSPAGNNVHKMENQVH